MSPTWLLKEWLAPAAKAAVAMIAATTTGDVLVALVAGAVGSLLTALIAFGVRVSRVGHEIRANDRALRVLDDHLETWATDETVRLRREIVAITGGLASRGLLRSGAYGRKVALAKEAALHAYRDQERTARSREADIIDGEKWMHDVWRRVHYRALVRGLAAPDRVRPILDEWATPVVRPGHPTAEVADPRQRSVNQTLADLRAQPL